MSAPDSERLRRSTACAAVLNSDGCILLQRRSDNGLWCLPGGAIEVGETAEQAVIREVGEETGYVVEAKRLIGVYSDPAQTTITYPEGDTVSYVALLFECRVVGGEPALSDETLDVDWFSPAALPASLTPGHIPRIHDALANRRAAFVR